MPFDPGSSPRVALQYNKHLFVHISQSSLSYSDPLLECVDIRQIYDKFPEKKGGLKELFSKGPQNAFYLIKFWVGTWPRFLSASSQFMLHLKRLFSLGVHLGVSRILGYLRGTSEVLWRLPLLPEHLPNFVHTGTRTGNPPLLIRLVDINYIRP